MRTSQSARRSSAQSVASNLGTEYAASHRGFTTEPWLADCFSRFPSEEPFKVIVRALYFIILAGSVIAAMPVATILLETIAAIALPQRIFASLSGGKTRDRVGVLIPAHNEEEMLSETIARIQPQLQPGDWLLVVADNCSDRTEAIAKSSWGGC